MALPDQRAQLLEKYGPYVRSLANGVRKQFNARLDMDDLIAYGQIGLYEAAERFDPRQGVNFLTFAHYRIKGAIFDGLRKMGALKGPDQRASYLSERSTSYMQSLSDRDTGGHRTFNDDVRDLENAVTSLAAIFVTSLDASEGLQIKDESLGPDERLELQQVKARVKVAIEKLPENERLLLIAYYYEGKTLEEAGAVIGQSKSWSSRLHARAIERLKAFLSEEMEVEATSGGPPAKMVGKDPVKAKKPDPATNPQRSVRHGNPDPTRR
ncbi:MAG: sigma-70 family RNA polymerase sigma factor [Myxococcales bacterium]